MAYFPELCGLSASLQFPSQEEEKAQTRRAEKDNAARLGVCSSDYQVIDADCRRPIDEVKFRRVGDDPRPMPDKLRVGFVIRVVRDRRIDR